MSAGYLSATVPQDGSIKEPPRCSTASSHLRSNTSPNGRDWSKSAIDDGGICPATAVSAMSIWSLAPSPA